MREEANRDEEIESRREAGTKTRDWPRNEQGRSGRKKQRERNTKPRNLSENRERDGEGEKRPHSLTAKQIQQNPITSPSNVLTDISIEAKPRHPVNTAVFSGARDAPPGSDT